MPEEKEKSEKSAGKAASEEPRTYHRDRLVTEAQGFFGEPGYVIEAALSSGRAAQKQNFTLDEVKDAVKEYNDHEVEIDHPVEGGEGE